MTAPELVLNNPEFFKDAIPGLDKHIEVRNQAIEHTHRLDKSNLLEIQRPSEPDEVKEYRNNIIRQITKAPINKFKTKTTRIVQTSGFAINQS